MPLAVLLTVAGDQVPVMLLFDVVGRTGAVDPLHIGATGAKVGVMLAGSTVIFLDTEASALLHASVAVHVSVTVPPPSPAGT